MISSMSRFVSRFLLKYRIIDRGETDIYEYGFEIIISSLVGFILVIVIGMIYDIFLYALTYFAIFTFIRRTTGGYHAETYFKCNLVFSIVSFTTMGMTCVSYENELYSFPLHLLLLITAIVVVYKYAPVESPNKPLDEEQRKSNHAKGVIYVVALAIGSCIMYCFSLELSILIAYTLFMVSMLLMVVVIKEGRD